jgi:signal transduction histidine kinase
LTGRSKAADANQPAPQGLVGSRLRNARIRSKLGFILIIPLIAIIALAGLRLVDSGQRTLAANLVHSLTLVSAEVSGVAQELHAERMVAARLLGDPDAEAVSFNAQAARTDDAVQRYRQARADLADVPGLVDERLERVDEQLATLGAIREGVLTDGALATAVLRYGGIVRDLTSYQESVAQVAVDADLAESIRALAALSKATAHLSDSAIEAYLALSEDEVSEDSLTPFLATLVGRQEALVAFSLAATPEQQALVNSYYTGGVATLADLAERDVLRSAGDPVITREAAANALGAITDNVRYAEEILHADQVGLATALRDEVLQQVLIESGAVVATLIVAILIASLLARALARSLGRLREGALTVANRELPETVARFSDPQTLGDNTPAQIAAQVRDPIQLRSRDEIGEVAQAFNVVHQAAVRVAAEQAALRTSVSAMFLNLARRSQTLVDRIINELDDIERNEEDPKRLSRLFALDHLATRMRRNDENLLVLAGADSGPSRSDDAPVPDVLRASQSEVEHYDRIEFGTVDADVSVRALAVNDVVRLVAELFDNATRFSPPSAPVVAEARRLGDQVIIQVEDHGVGMPQDQLNEINTLLASPPAVEFNTFRRMGLAVVARLATRHRIRVELRSDMRTGTVVYVALPPNILILPQHRSRAAEIPAPRAPLASEQTSQPPPLPARHLGQLPRRSAEVVSHSARRRAVEPSSGATQASTATSASAVTTATEARSASTAAAAGAAAAADGPVAGRPPEALLTRHPRNPSAAPAAAAKTSDATAELPIFQEMEAVWFRSHGELDLGTHPQQSAAGGAGGTVEASGAGATGAASAASAYGHAARASGDTWADEWQTAADEGWSAAAKAAEPPAGGSTRSGLPKRVPQAQLVPGGVHAPSGGVGTQRRSPEEVRGLLSAYHRGVQRGREHGGQ